MTPKAARRAGRRTERATELATEGETEEQGGAIALTDAAQADDELTELANQMADGAMLTLYRLLDGGEKEFVDEQPVAGFTVGAVARRFGGGRYVIYLRKPDPDVAGKSIRQGSKRFTVSGAPKYPTDDAIAAPAAAGALESAKLSATYGELIQTTTRQALEQAQLLQQMQLAVLASLTNRPPDSSLELLKTLLPALIGKQSDKGITIADAIALGDRMSNRNTPAASLKETLELLQTARELGGGEAAAPPWMGVAAKAIEVIGRAIVYNPRQLPNAGVDVTQELPPAPDTPPTEVPTVAPNAHPLLSWLAPQIPGLVDHAQADHEPDNYAGPIVDQIPKQHRADVVAFLTSPDFVAQLQAAFPMTQPLQQWFEELRDCVVDRVNEELNPSPAPATPAVPEQ